MSIFNFKQFKISHAESFKVGTDGVLLGCWVDIDDDIKVLDVGTGSGLIALIIAQRSSTDCIIDGVEVDHDAYREATANIKNSPWSNRVKVFHSDFQSFEKEKLYDHIVSNPPYFINSTKSGQVKKDNARHTDSLSFEDLIITAKKLLAPEGKLSVILPTIEALMFVDLAKSEGFELIRRTKVKTRTEKNVERHLMTFTQATHFALLEDDLVIQKGGRNVYTDEYIALTKAFYTIL